MTVVSEFSLVITRPIVLIIMYALEWRTVSALTRGLFWCLCPELRSNEGNKHQNNTRVSAETVRHESTYIILFLTRLNESINDDKNNDLYTSSPVSHLLSSRSADDVTINCWWRHKDLTIVMRSNSLDIDFIHDRSCKKNHYCIQHDNENYKIWDRT